MSPAIDLKKRLGQHHLLRGHLCGPLLEYLPLAGRRVVEIGPGGGVLTDELLSAGARVTALELDPEWAFDLRRKRPDPALEVVIADALEVDWGHLPAASLVTGNLPYGVATPIIERLLAAWRSVSRAAFLVQLEVARRLVAGPGDPEYGALSIMVATRAQVRFLGRIGRGSFQPPPRVDGGMVGFKLVAPPRPEMEMAEFYRWVRALFGLRRKALRNSLGRLWSPAAGRHALAACGVAELERPERLAPETLLQLFDHRPAIAPTGNREC